MERTFTAPWWGQLARLAPGVGLAALIGLVAWGLQAFEQRLIGHPVIEALVIAIVLGMLWRNLRGVDAQMAPGVAFTANDVLRFAIVLLGASIDLPTVLQAGPSLLITVIVVVVVGIAASMTIGQRLGLNAKLAILVAVGNSICGNSAIAAVAPVIKADAKDVTSSIALTAVLAVVVVLLLPLLIPLLGLTLYQYGVLAGLTVYAVPHVVAATFPVSALSSEIGTLVKLVRVLLLGPVVIFFSLRYRQPGATSRLSLTRFVPWFIIGFLILGIMRSVGLLPVGIAGPLREISRWLTVASMAALGLGVDVRAVRQVGAQVGLAVVASLVVLMIVSILLILGLGIDSR